MHPKKFIEKIEEARIVAAIGRAEQGTSGEIRVSVSHRDRKDALVAARTRFLQLGMDRTPQRNGVLIYLVPRAHTFAIWGDIAAHKACGEELWKGIAARISPRLKAGQISEAIEEAVREVGEVLARHFPRGSDGQNHLSDAVVRG